jgi:hypothetical protein
VGDAHGGEGEGEQHGQPVEGLAAGGVDAVDREGPLPPVFDPDSPPPPPTATTTSLDLQPCELFRCTSHTQQGSRHKRNQIGHPSQFIEAAATRIAGKEQKARLRVPLASNTEAYPEPLTEQVFYIEPSVRRNQCCAPATPFRTMSPSPNDGSRSHAAHDRLRQEPVVQLAHLSGPKITSEVQVERVL